MGRPPGETPADRSSGSPGETPSALVAALADPARVRLLATLAIHPPLGIDELAAHAGMPARAVRRLVHALLDAGLVGIAREEGRRGVVKRYYEGLRPPVLDPAEDAALSARERRLVSLGALRAILAVAGPAVASQALPERCDRLVAGLPGRVDERGWRELVAFHRATLERVQAVMAASRDRLDRGAEPVTVISAQILLEIGERTAKEGGGRASA